MARAATIGTGIPHTLKFSVDSALLRELGERLVGKAHVALAELVKNSYDADATDVTIVFEKDRIVIADNGHGMNFAEFSKFWMRIGSSPCLLLRWRQTFPTKILVELRGSLRLGIPYVGARSIHERIVQLSISVESRQVARAELRHYSELDVPIFE